MSGETRRILEALNMALHRRENHWRNVDRDDHQIAKAVMVAIGEVRLSIIELLEANDRLTPEPTPTP